MDVRGTQIVALATLAVWLAAAPVGVAQTPAPSHRALSGKPDLGGVWSNADEPVTITQTIAGERQTSSFDEPWDTKLPFRDRASAMAWREKYGIYMSGKPQPEFTLGPDSLPNRDRCLMAANAAAPPMTSQGYNDAYQIVQTPSYVAIAVEMMDEMRIVPIFADRNEAVQAHLPSALQRWTGDPVGWWEGDTLIVETRSISARQREQSGMPMSQDATVIERFTRASDSELLYQAEVTDPAIYARSWTIAYRFHPTRRIWEYACHEGNYGMVGILTGVRKTERDHGKAARSSPH